MHRATISRKLSVFGFGLILVVGLASWLHVVGTQTLVTRSIAGLRSAAMRRMLVVAGILLVPSRVPGERRAGVASALT